MCSIVIGQRGTTKIIKNSKFTSKMNIVHPMGVRKWVYIHLILNIPNLRRVHPLGVYLGVHNVCRCISRSLFSNFQISNLCISPVVHLLDGEV